MWVIGCNRKSTSTFPKVKVNWKLVKIKNWGSEIKQWKGLRPLPHSCEKVWLSSHSWNNVPADLFQKRSLLANSCPSSLTVVSLCENPVAMIDFREANRMPMELELEFVDCTSHVVLPRQTWTSQRHLVVLQRFVLQKASIGFWKLTFSMRLFGRPSGTSWSCKGPYPKKQQFVSGS